MPNKKAARNAYFFFVMEKLPELRARGFAVKGVKDAIPLCSDDWGLLTVEEKERYAEMARKWKEGDTSISYARSEPKPQVSYARSPHGQQVSYARSPPRQQNPIRATPAAVERVLETVVPRVVKTSWPNDQAVLSHVIYFLEIFSLGEMPPPCERRFLPCEIGCIRYSLQDGILGEFHRFVDPGEIPRGFRYHCQAGSEASHKIPISGFELAEANNFKIFSELCEFIGSFSSSFIPVYCKRENCYQVNWCLNWLARKAGRMSRLQACELEDLVVKIYEHKLNEEPSITLVRSMLEVFQWDYTRNTRCKWHEENDIVDCALAVCKKHTYCISDSLAPIYGFQLTSAHIPECGERCGTIINPKMVVLDAGRFMKSKSQNSLEGRYFSSPSLKQEATAVGGEQSVPPNGVIPGASSTVHGRGIARGKLF